MDVQKMACLTFIIPVRHQDCSAHWDLLVKNLEETIQSISAQTSPDWKCVIVANEEAQLPEMPEKFEVCYVDFPPNKLYAKEGVDQKIFYEAVRTDKGKRILAGIEHAKPTDYVMFVDDDDFIHRDLTKFVYEHKGENGWFFPDGWLWQNGTDLFMKYDEFFMICGTSHIVRTDLLTPRKDNGEIDIEYIKDMFGSHNFIAYRLGQAGNQLKPLPFRGAIYRLGHSDAHSKSKGIIYSVFSLKRLVKNPIQSIMRLFALRIATKKLREHLKTTYNFG